MAERVVLADDLDNSEEGVTSHVFSIDGSAYKIDLSPTNLQKLTKALQPFIDAGRPSQSEARQVTPIAKPAGRKRASSGAAAVGADARAIRVWAAENNKEVPARGRIPKPLIDEYLAATGS